MSESHDSNTSGTDRLATTAMAIIVFVWLSALVVVVTIGFKSSGNKLAQDQCDQVENNFDFKTLGELGDSFGLINALLGGLAAAVAYAAFSTQGKQIAEERLSRRSDEVVNHFVLLLEVLQGMVSGVKYNNTSGETLTGVNAICQMENDLIGNVDLDGNFRNWGVLRAARIDAGKTLEPSTSCQFDPLPRAIVAREFGHFQERFLGAGYAHILRLQLHLLKFIETERDVKHSINDKTANTLLATFRALLSDPEMHMLLYYGLRNAEDNQDLQLMDRTEVLFALLTKSPTFVCHRIPELKYYENTSREWMRRCESRNVEMGRFLPWSELGISEIHTTD